MKRQPDQQTRWMKSNRDSLNERYPQPRKTIMKVPSLAASFAADRDYYSQLGKNCHSQLCYTAFMQSKKQTKTHTSARKKAQTSARKKVSALSTTSSRSKRPASKASKSAGKSKSTKKKISE